MAKKKIKQTEQTLTSMEVAEMVEKEHSKLLRDIRRYISQMGEAKIGFTDFFTESSYLTEQGKNFRVIILPRTAASSSLISSPESRERHLLHDTLIAFTKWKARSGRNRLLMYQ